MHLYRYEGYSFTLPFFDHGGGATPSKFQVLKTTPHGYWIKSYTGKRKWVPKAGKNLYAFANKEEALYNFTKRHEKYINTLEARIETAKSNLSIAQKVLKEKHEKWNTG